MHRVDDPEVLKFSDLASEWWDGSSFSVLHKVNAVRVGYVLSQLGNVSPKLSLLDVGCGGGIFAESMALLGFSVTGIDPSQESIEVASRHARISGLDIRYHSTYLDEFCERHEETYDIVTLMEVAEHVDDLESCLSHACVSLKKGGILFLSTLNRTFKSMVLAVIAAEYVLRWIPKGTHSWNKFIKPAEVCSILRAKGVIVQDISGMGYMALRNEWCIVDNVDVNYILTAKKL
ncbi:bifunctional 2-polyprenyl-6-hydroxyphenol methylase/3-demethylubiquinol 3-O-methyltransferase UbiG [Anaplasma capra]|uniref:bifunctional 2-polyprenyl-6-hydroxyphenol methylase/3-demethylubiquinol 3-O-methyltransferase UbiG n=1 Tax=Anaplasma capra TaxID=1562740 RepID=UPI0021D5BA1A|nr:bifunctional 2-polyprenyl-6-hydroxyphenol methylase/3-demethylubiquinol 3-O-methyltransferase UbiG [Anaplasma capra]MCU7611672.1 bifunctional 2-polyprenyl-6-hydroxyphenol methylase/3-demethylubiquinol 3-O-methyltransferase UbiG [Anaplasma capra]MCU7612178.1 bifunctional 2-polyprenyl-6-hydroxyphenol methylase/3-demethylubiquinol 3-O-methyltransferase UbiG [Anaplasma capra]